MVAAASLGETLVEPLGRLLVQVVGDLGPELLDVEARVPHGHVGGPGEAAHGLLVAAYGAHGDLVHLLVVVAVLTARDDQARDEPFHVPLPRTRERLVEVVDVEDEPPLGRGEHPEVGQVRVPAQLHGDPGGGAGREVGGHDGGGPPEEGERGHQHPFVPQRDQLGQPGRDLRGQDLHRVRAVAGDRVGVAGQRHLHAEPGAQLRAGRDVHAPGRWEGHAPTQPPARRAASPDAGEELGQTGTKRRRGRHRRVAPKSPAGDEAARPGDGQTPSRRTRLPRKGT